MAKRPITVPFTVPSLDGANGVPLYRQLYDGLRRAILDGQLRAGTRLPSTRELAIDLGVSRNTVMNAFEQLLAEGYVEGQVGSGTYVSRALPDDLLHARMQTTRAPQRARKGRTLARSDEHQTFPPRHARARRLPARALGASARAPLAQPAARTARLRRVVRLC